MLTINKFNNLYRTNKTFTAWHSINDYPQNIIENELFLIVSKITQLNKKKYTAFLPLPNGKFLDLISQFYLVCEIFRFNDLKNYLVWFDTKTMLKDYVEQIS